MPKATATRAERRASRDAGAIAPYSGLQLAYAALIAAVSVASGLQAQQRGSLYGGRSVAQKRRMALCSVSSVRHDSHVTTAYGSWRHLTR